MPLLFALTVSIGLLAVVATWLFLGPLAALGVQIWQAFVAWASFYNNGGKGGRWIGAYRIYVPLERLADHDLIVPASRFRLLAGADGLTRTLILLGKDMTPTAAIVPTIVSILIGTAFGWLSEFIGGKLAKS